MTGQGRQIHLRPRLAAAMELLRGCHTVGDIGCDHGRLGCALLQSGGVNRVIAGDISGPSLEKARQLAALTGLADRMETRLGDGLSVLGDGEADGIAILGMGGTLMAELLEHCETPLCGAKRAVLQPMRAPEDIREWLYRKKYRIEQDRIVRENGRYYQIFSVLPPEQNLQSIPPDWPENYWKMGFVSYESRDPLLLPYCGERLARVERKLRQYQAPSLLEDEACLLKLLNLLKKEEPTDAAR